MSPTRRTPTLQGVRRGLGQSAAVGLDQRAADGDQGAAAVHQRRLQGSHVIELDGREAAHEAVRRRLRHLLVEVLPPWRGEEPSVSGRETGSRKDGV